MAARIGCHCSGHCGSWRLRGRLAGRLPPGLAVLLLLLPLQPQVMGWISDSPSALLRASARISAAEIFI